MPGDHAASYQAEDNRLTSWTSAPLTQLHQPAAILGCPKRGHRTGRIPRLTRAWATDVLKLRLKSI